MAYIETPNPNFQAIGADGLASPGALLYTFLADSSTPYPTWTDSSGDNQNQNPVECDASGRASVWRDSTKLYKFVLKTSAGVTIWTLDYIGLTTTQTLYSSDYPTLQAAFDAAEGKNLIIRGDYTASSQLDLPSSGIITMEPGSMITLNVTDLGLAIPDGASNLTLDGIVLSGVCARGIFGTDVTKVTIRNCEVSGATLAPDGLSGGIFLNGATNCLIENNYLHDNGTGENDGYGDIVFYTGTNVGNYLINNRCVSTDVRYNIICFVFSQGVIDKNTCFGAAIFGVLPEDQDHGYGIAIYDDNGSHSNYNRITSNLVSTTDGCGIYLASSVFNTLTGNLLVNTAVTQDDSSLPVGAICINSDGSGYSTVTGNVIYTTGKDGICLASSGYDTLSGNTVISAGTKGIRLRGSCDYTTLSGNTISDCVHGIYSDVSSKNGLMVTGNTIQASSEYGMFFSGLTTSNISGNSVYDSGKDGININAGSQNNIGNNNVVNSSASGANTYSGIVNVSDYTTISDNTSVNTGATGQKWGINNSGSYGTIVGNTLSKNQTSGLNDTGTAMTKSNNKLSIGVSAGTATLTGGTVTINTAEVQAGDVITLTPTTAGGTPGVLAVSTITGGTSFVVTSSSGTDTSSFGWKLNNH